MKKCLVYKDATSDKFWTIEVNGNYHTVSYGRTGTEGQRKTKEFSSNDEALKDAEKLILSKIKKGYNETGSKETGKTLEDTSFSPRMWAESYFKRFDRMVQELRAHPLVDRVVYIQYKGLNDQEISSIENDVKEELNLHEVPSENSHADFKLDPFMMEFYKISNGLHFAWNSQLFPPSISESRILKDESIDSFIVAGDENDPCEGWISILPLQGLLNSGSFGVYGDPYDTSYGGELKEKGGLLVYLDFFHYYYDTCIVLGGERGFSLAFGDDHSACYKDAGAYDFVLYMEFLLARYGSILGRRDLNSLEYRDCELYERIKTLKEDKSYHLLPELFEKVKVSIDDVVMNNYKENGYDYIPWEHLEAKPEEIFTKIEKFLDVDLREEFDL